MADVTLLAEGAAVLDGDDEVVGELGADHDDRQDESGPDEVPEAEEQGARAHERVPPQEPESFAEPVTPPLEHHGEVVRVVWSPDGKQIAVTRARVNDADQRPESRAAILV